MERTEAPISDWPKTLERRLGGYVLLGGVEIWHDFDWHEVIGHDRGVFRNCKSIGRKINQYTPEGSKPVLLLTERSDMTGYTVRGGSGGQVVHILNVRDVPSVSADAADTLVGHGALPEFDLTVTISQLEAFPKAVDELVARNLNADKVLEWATRSDQSIQAVTEAITSLDVNQLGRAVAIAFAVVAHAGNWPLVLRNRAPDTDETILSLAAAGAAYAQQSLATERLESLLAEIQPE